MEGAQAVITAILIVGNCYVWGLVYLALREIIRLG